LQIDFYTTWPLLLSDTVAISKRPFRQRAKSAMVKAGVAAGIGAVAFMGAGKGAEYLSREGPAKAKPKGK